MQHIISSNNSLYVCSTKIALKNELMKTNNEIVEKMSFKDYFESLSNDSKTTIREQMTPIHMSYTTFYDKLRNNSWKELEIRELERITGKQFAR